MNIKPLFDKVLVSPMDAESKTKSGIIIPDTAKEKPLMGIVKAIGPGLKSEPMELKIGETILYGKYTGNELEFEGKTYLLMRQADVFATLENNS